MARRTAIVLACGYVACGGSSKKPHPDAPPDVIGSVLTGTVLDEGSSPVAGAQVCIVGHPEVPCATSAADGTYSIHVAFLPADADLAVTTTASGHLGGVALLHETMGGLLWEDVPLWTDASATTRLATQGGFTYPTAQDGFVELDVQGATVGSLTGATASLSPASGAGPVYADPTGTLDRARTSTSSSGFAFFGNVAPGMYAITVTAAQKTCSVMNGASVIAGDWPGAGSATTAVQVVAGAMTQRISVICK
jgi:hypothetical protein